MGSRRTSGTNSGKPKASSARSADASPANPWSITTMLLRGLCEALCADYCVSPVIVSSVSQETGPGFYVSRRAT